MIKTPGPKIKKPALSIVAKESKKKTRTRKKPEPIVPEEDGLHSSPEQNLVDVAHSQMDAGTKKILEAMYLHGMSIKQACEHAGVKYYRSKMIVARSEVAKAYIEHLLERAAVIREFGVDDLHLVELVKIRDMARNTGQGAAATRAHEICMKAIGRLSKEERPQDSLKSVKEMTRKEMLEEFSRYKMKADGEPLVSTEKSVQKEKAELLARGSRPAAILSPPNDIGARINFA